MGRKPNQLILEYFERGQKLDNATNRYQHTCRSCGEKFPKGRVDSLISHLVKRCPALPLRDRQQLALPDHELSTSPDPAPPPAVKANSRQKAAANAVSLALSHTKQAMSALDTLAEVSRHHLDISDTKHLGQNRRRGRSRQSALSHIAAKSQSRKEHSATESAEPGSHNRDGDYRAGVLPRNDDLVAGLPSINKLIPPLDTPLANHQPSHLHLPQLSGLSPAIAASNSPLIRTASAANELQALLPKGQLAGMSPEDDPTDGHTENGSAHSGATTSGQAAAGIDPLLQDITNDAYATIKISNIPENHFKRSSHTKIDAIPADLTQEFRMNRKPAKSKVRGKFTDARRKEVQEVRKRGACIRCRMLKKPCSGESPCSTCISVESARLWKQPCIRTRIADEFNLYSTGLRTILTFHALGQAKHRNKFEAISGRIEATHFPEELTYATFSVLKAQLSSSSSMMYPSFRVGTVSQASNEALKDLYIINSHSEDLSGKLEQYMRRLAPVFQDTEPSVFARNTVKLGTAVSLQSKDDLLASVLELWVATQILTDPETTLTIFANTALPPSLIPARLTPSEVNANAASNSRAAIEPIRSCESYHLITLQILAAAEKRASALSKIVMNGLERRLLQRHQADAFETFLVAVILLLCVERMSWYFQTWNTSRAHTSESTAAVVQSLASSPTGSMNEFEVRVAEALTEAATVAASGSTKFARMQTDGHADDTAPSARDAPILPPISSLITQPSTEDSFAVDDNDGVLRMNSGSRLPTLGEWPLDHEPAYYSHQGERFAEIVHMLLKMRAIPPRTLVLEPGETDGLASSIAAHSTNMPDIDGASYAHNDLEAEAHEKMTFRTTEDDTEPERIIMPIDLATDGQIVRDWFASLRLTPQMLNDARDSPFHPHNARCWELKYVERILRPLEV